MTYNKDQGRVDGLAGSGADWLPRLKLYIEDGKTVIVAPHKVFVQETNDVVLQTAEAEKQEALSRLILFGEKAFGNATTAFLGCSQVRKSAARMERSPPASAWAELFARLEGIANG